MRLHRAKIYRVPFDVRPDKTHGKDGLCRAPEAHDKSRVSRSVVLIQNGLLNNSSYSLLTVATPQH
jgi:hypothetical protein